MCFGGKPKIPDPPPPPTETDASRAALRETREQRRAASASGRTSTILTGPQGVSDTGSTKKTLLGA